MFDSKKKQLFTVASNSTVKSAFVQAGLKKSAETTSVKGALKYSTTGNPGVDQFGKIGMYKQPRSFTQIVEDCETLWAWDKRLSVVFIFYLRTIVRIVKLFTGVSTKAAQKGAQLKHESIMRMMWLFTKSEATFWKNIGLFVSLGSWKDIITMLQYDLVYHGWKDRVLNWEKFGDLLLSGLENKQTSELIKKYLPQLRANSKCTTVESQADNIIAKWICSLLYGNKESSVNYKKYRKLKASGTAHEWQKLISRKEFDRIDFNTIHGRALNLLVKGKFLYNSGLKDKYTKFVTDPDKKELKFTGFVHEVMDLCSIYYNIVSMPVHKQETCNKQFAELIKKGEGGEQTKFIVVRDTSGSMEGIATGTNMSSGNIAKSIALYFSYFLKGQFADSWIEFNVEAQMKKWKGNTPVEKWFNDKSEYIGTTNFQSVIDLFWDIKGQGVPEEDFPTGILCISDGEFDPSSLNKTNVETALDRLRRAGFSKDFVNNFVIVLWNIPHSRGSHGNKFETYGNVPNVYYFSGYEPSVITFLTGKIKNAEELFLAAMDQEILNMIELC